MRRGREDPDAKSGCLVEDKKSAGGGLGEPK